MKRLFVIIAFAAIVASCAKPKTWTISANFNPEYNLNGKTAILSNMENPKDTIATCVVENNAVSITGDFTEYKECRFVIKDEVYASLILDNGVITIVETSKPHAKYREFEAQGTKVNDFFNDYTHKISEPLRKFNRRYWIIRRDSLEKELITLDEFTATLIAMNKTKVAEMRAVIDSFNTVPVDGALRPFMLRRIKDGGNSRGSEKSFVAMCESSPESALDYSDNRKFYEQCKAVVNTCEGCKFIDFTVEKGNLDGTTAKLSDYVGKGKYVIVDFWASWCGHCLNENQYLRRLYDKYKGDKFDIVSVAVGDEIEASLKAMKEHNMTWPVILNAQHIPHPIYGFSGIPMLLLVGPDGTILARDIRGEQMVQIVSGYLDK